MGIVLLLAIVAVAGMACLFDPMKNIFSPQCQFHLLTGWSCPGCGVQRAFHSLAHGRIAEALSYNYFLVVSIPYALAVMVAWVMKQRGHYNRVIAEIEHPKYVKLFVVLFFVWWVVRNIYQI